MIPKQIENEAVSALASCQADVADICEENRNILTEIDAILMKNQRSQMGDYGFGVSGADQALSPVDLGQLNNNHSLFSPEPLTTPIKMQEENLLEKSQVKANLKASFNEAGSGEPKLEDATKVLDLNNEAQTSSNGVSSHGDQREDTLNDDAVNSVITSLSQLGLTSDVNITGPNIVSSAAPGLWSTAGGDDSLIPAMQSMNGFQPPVHSNPAVNGSFGNLANHQLPLSTLAGVQPPPLRRAITSQNRNAIQQVQQNIFLNNPKTYQSWSNGSPQVDWSQRNQLQNPWTGLPNQRKSMGSLNNLAVANQFKNANIKPAMVMSPSKFRRSTSHPAQFPQNNFGHKAGIEINGLDHGNQFDHLLALQQASRKTVYMLFFCGVVWQNIYCIQMNYRSFIHTVEEIQYDQKLQVWLYLSLNRSYPSPWGYGWNYNPA